MGSSDFIIEVSEANFDYEVIAFSQQTPVVVDFWAPWCAPCRVLGPLLEKLAREANGDFRLAKVDIDQNPKLATQFNVRSIPAVKAFKEGKMVAEFVGAQPEPRLREFIGAFTPSPDNLSLEKGRSLLDLGEGRKAEAVYRQVLQNSPEQPEALLGLSKSLLLQGLAEESHVILRNFPASRQLATAELLRPLAMALEELDENRPDDDDMLQPAYYHSLRLVRRGNLEAALDGLLDILRQDKNYRSGEPRRVILALLELMGETNPATRQYRAELANVLF